MSRAVWLTGIAIVAVAGLLFFKSTQPKEESSLNLSDEIAEGEAATIQIQNWHEFTSPAGDFKVLFPALPQHAAETINDPKTQEQRQYDMYVSEKSNGAIFMISIIRMPNDSVTKLNEKMLPDVINDMMSSSPKSKLTKMEMGSFKGNPSIEYSFENDQVNVDGKAFIAGNSLYLLTNVAKKGDAQKQEFDYFTNSFQLIKK